MTRMSGTYLYHYWHLSDCIYVCNSSVLTSTPCLLMLLCNRREFTNAGFQGFAPKGGRGPTWATLNIFKAFLKSILHSLKYPLKVAALFYLRFIVSQYLKMKLTSAFGLTAQSRTVLRTQNTKCVCLGSKASHRRLTAPKPCDVSLLGSEINSSEQQRERLSLPPVPQICRSHRAHTRWAVSWRQEVWPFYHHTHWKGDTRHSNGRTVD